jgi:hypothetical protein
VNTAIAIGPNLSATENAMPARTQMTVVFVVVGLILLFAAIRILRRRSHHRHHY